MTALALFLLALDFLLAIMLLDAEWDDESRRLPERVEARRRALRQKEIDRERCTTARRRARDLSGREQN